MLITWLGHSCFLIENSLDEKIILDPFNKSMGGNPYVGSADIITISHNHFDHNFTDFINTGATIIKTPCTYESDTIKIEGFPSYHDNAKGAKRGENIIFLIESDNFRLCHLGDLGHMLTDSEIDLIDNIDILFIPVDSNFTLNPNVASNLCNKINCKLIIPMHYKTSSIDYPVYGIEKFIALMKNAMNLKSNSLVIDNFMDQSRKVVLFNQS